MILPLLLLAVLFVPFAFTPGAEDPFGLTQRLLTHAIALVIGVVWAFRGGPHSRGHSSFVFLIGALLWASLSGALFLYLQPFGQFAFAAQQTHLAFLDWCAVILCFALALSVFRDGAWRERFPAAIAAVGGALALLGVLQALGLLFSGWETVPGSRVYATLGSPNFLAAHLAFALPVALGLGLDPGPASRPRGTAARLSWWAVSALLLSCLYLTRTRTAVLAVAAGIAVLALTMGRTASSDPGIRKKTAVRALALALLLGGVTGLFWIGGGLSSLSGRAGVSLDQRVLQWKAAWEIVRSHPLWGAGPGSFRSLYPEVQARLLADPANAAVPPIANMEHAHQDALEVAGEWGWPGFLAFAVFLSLTLGAGFRAARGSPVAAGVLGGSAGFLVTGLANFPFYVPSLAAWFWVSLGWLNAARNDLREPVPWTVRGEILLRWGGAVAVSLVCLLSLGWLASIWRANVLLGEAKALSVRGLHRTALEVYQRAAAMNPGGIHERFYLGTALRLAGQTEASIREYRLIEPLASNRQDVLDNIGSSHYLSSQIRFYEHGDKDGRAAALTEAVKAYEAALALDPRPAALHNNYGAALADLGRLAEARREFETSIRIDPGFPDAWNGLGNVLDLQQERGCVAAWEKAIALKPDFMEPVYNLAAYWAAHGDPRKARSLFERVLQIQPGFRPAEEGLKQLTGKAPR